MGYTNARLCSSDHKPYNKDNTKQGTGEEHNIATTVSEAEFEPETLHNSVCAFSAAINQAKNMTNDEAIQRVNQ